MKRTFQTAVLPAFLLASFAAQSQTFDASNLSFSAFAKTACTANSQGVVTPPTPGQNCNLQPEVQQITLYRLFVCTSKPTAPTSNTTANLTSCASLYSNSAGQTITVTKTATSALTGTTRPANATYTHAYVEISPSWQVKAKAAFSSAMGDSNGTTSGTTCWSIANAANNGNLYNWSIRTQGSMDLVTKCGATTDNTYAATTIVTNSFDGSSFVNAVTNAPISNGGTTSLTNKLDSYLLASSGFLATPGIPAVNNANSVSKIGAVLTLPTSLTISSATTGMTFSVNNSMGTQIATQTPVGSNPSRISFFTTGPADFTLTTTP
jgi:hypothetical protein